MLQVLTSLSEVLQVVEKRIAGCSATQQHGPNALILRRHRQLPNRPPPYARLSALFRGYRRPL